MKKITAVIFILTITCLLILKLPASALDISLGGNVWFSWWAPAWESNINAKIKPDQFFQKIYLDKPDYKIKPSFLYGPVLSIRIIDRLSISSTFVLGYYKAYSRGEYPTTSDYLDIDVSYIKATRINKKYDSDTTIAYGINKYIKIFAGFKYQGYDYDYHVRWVSQILTFRIPWTGKGKSLARNYGPGVGIGLTVNLIENFYLLSNVSGLIMWGKEEAVLDLIISGIGSVLTSHYKKGVYFSYGANTSVSFAYYISAINTTISLGARYQVLRYEQKDHNRGFTDFDNSYDHFYGVTFSLVYTFPIKIAKKTESSFKKEL